MVVKSAGKNKDQERFETLSAVKDLNALSEGKLRKIADCLEEETFDKNQCIIKQVNMNQDFNSKLFSAKP
jgi:hypothetical protein